LVIRFVGRVCYTFAVPLFSFRLHVSDRYDYGAQ
jgi:hypothetical protein